MNFLSKLLRGIAFVPAVVNGIEGLFGNRTGNDKKEAALSFVGAALSTTEAIANRDILDEEKFRQGLSKVIDGTVDCLNASTWAKK
jgi:hypothetical protein